MSEEQRRGGKMDTTTWVMAGVAILLLVIAFWRERSLPWSGVLLAGRTLWHNLPLLLLGFLIAGLVQVLVPREVISGWLGEQAGFRGILLASVIGGVMPGSPYSVFPLIGGVYHSGAGLGAVVACFTAWALWSVSRLPVEMAMIDAKVALVRYGITFVVPPVAGLLAQLIGRIL